jgi:hypothetical protein
VRASTKRESDAETPAATRPKPNVDPDASIGSMAPLDRSTPLDAAHDPARSAKKHGVGEAAQGMVKRPALSAIDEADTEPAEPATPDRSTRPALPQSAATAAAAAAAAAIKRAATAGKATPAGEPSTALKSAQPAAAAAEAHQGSEKSEQPEGGDTDKTDTSKLAVAEVAPSTPPKVASAHPSPGNASLVADGAGSKAASTGMLCEPHEM